MKHLLAISLYLFSLPAFSFEYAGDKDIYWFFICESSQPDFNLDKVYDDYVKYYYPDHYSKKEKITDFKEVAINEIQSILNNSVTCYEQKEFDFKVTIENYDKYEGGYAVEKIPGKQSIKFDNKIFSSLPGVFEVRIDDLILPEIIIMPEYMAKRLEQKGYRMYMENSGEVCFKLKTIINRVNDDGVYKAVPTSGKLLPNCSGMHKSLIEFNYVEN